jgi:tRNA-Thr(GGU) m(6)t(6)A37 methyltransferase TsaA
MTVNIRYVSIGVIRSPFKEVSGMPIQPSGARGTQGEVVLLEEHVPGLKDLEGFSHIILLYHFHLSKEPSLLVKPFLDEVPRGVFATRTPARPNPIGLSVVKLTGIRENRVLVEDIDVVDGTPLLDIKPYVPRFDCRVDAIIGWLAGKMEASEECRSDDRFSSHSGRPTGTEVQQGTK